MSVLSSVRCHNAKRVVEDRLLVVIAILFVLYFVHACVCECSLYVWHMCICVCRNVSRCQGRVLGILLYPSFPFSLDETGPPTDGGAVMAAIKP